MKYEGKLGDNAKYTISADVKDGILVVEETIAFQYPVQALVDKAANGLIDKIEATSLGQNPAVHDILENLRKQVAVPLNIASAPATEAAKLQGEAAPVA